MAGSRSPIFLLSNIMPRHALIAFCSLVGTNAFGGLDLAATLPPGVAAAATAAAAALGGVAAGRLAKSDDADDRWLNDWTQKTRGAAALWALMDCGIVDALPDRDCPGLSSAELIAAARETTERAPAADAADAVARLLRHLALLKFCDESPTWRFRHSARSQAFASDDLARSRALSNLSPALVRPWWRVSEALQQNEAPFSLEHGGSAWDYLSENERDARHFDNLMRGLSEKGGAERSLVALGASDAAFAWSELPPGSRVVDVGGGEGHLRGTNTQEPPAPRRHVRGPARRRGAGVGLPLGTSPARRPSPGRFSTACPPATSTCSSGSCTTGTTTTR